MRINREFIRYIRNSKKSIVWEYFFNALKIIFLVISHLLYFLSVLPTVSFPSFLSGIHPREVLLPTGPWKLLQASVPDLGFLNPKICSLSFPTQQSAFSDTSSHSQNSVVLASWRPSLHYHSMSLVCDAQTLGSPLPSSSACSLPKYSRTSVLLQRL